MIGFGHEPPRMPVFDPQNSPSGLARLFLNHGQRFLPQQAAPQAQVAIPLGANYGGGGIDNSYGLVRRY